jgi:hypothetical protein
MQGALAVKPSPLRCSRGETIFYILYVLKSRCHSEESPAPIVSGERRKSPRKATAVLARIVLPFGKEVPCSIGGLSDVGARLTLQSVLGIPVDFELRIGRDTYRAHIIRRGVRSLAVRLR